MSIQRAEDLKREWTDKYVSVKNGVAELRRFAGLVGQVKTVNMNCRLLVEFDTPADISWYDIDPAYVVAVDPSSLSKPVEGSAKHEPQTTKSKQKAAAEAAATNSAAKANGRSPLDQIRQQSGGAPKAATPKTALSPLDAIRQQGAGGAAKSSAADATSDKPITAVVSPLDAIRSQHAGSDSPSSSSTPGGDVPTKAASRGGDSPLDKIRQQAASASPLDQIRAQNSSPKADNTAGVSEETTGGPSAHSAARLDHSASGATADDSANAIHEAPTENKSTADTDDSAKAPAAKSAADILQPAAFLSVPKSTSVSPLDQIRAQAGMDPNSGEVTIFDQVRAQADSDSETSSVTEQGRSAADENPARQTYRGNKLPKQDDLKIVEGIGPKIEELFHAADIRTWQALATADSERLSEILREAGPRFQMHNPETWPKQAMLAAEGKWQELEQYQDHLDGGREPGGDAPADDTVG